MSANDLLTQDEIDALLHGVSAGDVDTDSEAITDEDGTSAYDFTSQDRIVRGRLPTLEMINERFARYLRISMFNMLRKTSEISVGGVQMLKFSEYVHSLFVPASLNLVKIEPLRGTGLIVFDPKMVFSLVDNFFGGEGKFHAKVEGREFTPTEQRIIQIMLKTVFTDLIEAWGPVMKVDFKYLNMEVNPHFANIVSPSEVVVVSTFHVELEGGGGDIHVTMPYSMIEPIKDILDAGVQSDLDELDERWSQSLKKEMLGAEVELTSTLTRLDLPLRHIRSLKAGDILSIEIPDEITATVESVPVFKGVFGTSNGQCAIKITNFINNKN
jgi:flagellar motor switch protein FliM